MRVGRDTPGACEVVFLREDKSILTIRESRRQVFRGRNCLGTGARAGSGEGRRKQQVCEPGVRPLRTEEGG